jgi:hypothetical protein
VILRALWHIESSYRLVTDIVGEEREFNIFLAAPDDVLQVAQLIMQAVEYHVSEQHGSEVADFTVHSIERVDGVYLEGEE